MLMDSQYNAYNPNNISTKNIPFMYSDKFKKQINCLPTQNACANLLIHCGSINAKYGISSSFVVAEIYNYMSHESIINVDDLANKQYLKTKNYYSMDTLSCLQILFETATDNLTYKQIDIKDINLIKYTLNKNIPIMCSIKIIPCMFNNQYNDDLYWNTANLYYDSNVEHIHALSCMIIGYDDNEFKLMTHLKEIKYYNMQHCVFEKYDKLFFNSFVITSEDDQMNNTLTIFKKLNLTSLYSSEISLESLNDSLDESSTCFEISK